MFVTEQVQKGKKSRADKSASRSSKKSISEDKDESSQPQAAEV